jgi:hypothetical protein
VQGRIRRNPVTRCSTGSRCATRSRTKPTKSTTSR